MDLLKRVEEDQEDLNELMKKHKALIAQVSSQPVGLLHTFVLSLKVPLDHWISPPVIFPRSESFKLNWRR